jgi:hypothetical protein
VNWSLIPVKKSLLRSAALVATAALAVGAGLLAVSPAQAVVVGPAILSATSGNANTLLSVSTTGPCAAPATKVKVRADGFGFPATGLSVYSPQVIGFSTTDPMTNLNFTNSFKVYATNNSTALVGDYSIKVQCVNNLGTVVYDEWETTMTWATPGNDLANIDSATFEVETTSVATATTLTTSLPSPQDEGTAIDLTATITEDPTAGSVEFFDGATSLGTASVTAGSATLTGVVLADGVRSLTAAYGGSAGFEASTSAAVPFTVNNVVIATTTTLSVSGSGAQYTPATLDATVVPNNAVGTVEFYDGALEIGSKPLTGGTASLSIVLGLGEHELTAKFVPTNAADFDESTSAVVDYEVVASAGEIENITTEIPNGALTISVLDDGAVLLPASLTADGSQYVASGAMDPVRVVDTRAGNFGWTASGQLSPFTQGGSPSISAANLGWTPSVTSVSNGLMVVDAGAAVAAANAVAIGAGAGDGLSVSSTLASSAAGSSVGTAELGAVLDLLAPTTTLTGTHTAVLTLTAI